MMKALLKAFSNYLKLALVCLYLILVFAVLFATPFYVMYFLAKGSLIVAVLLVVAFIVPTWMIIFKGIKKESEDFNG